MALRSAPRPDRRSAIRTQTRDGDLVALTRHGAQVLLREAQGYRVISSPDGGGLAVEVRVLSTLQIVRFFRRAASGGIRPWDPDAATTIWRRVSAFLGIGREVVTRPRLSVVRWLGPTWVLLRVSGLVRGRPMDLPYAYRLRGTTSATPGRGRRGAAPRSTGCGPAPRGAGLHSASGWLASLRAQDRARLLHIHLPGCGEQRLLVARSHRLCATAGLRSGTLLAAFTCGAAAKLRLVVWSAGTVQQVLSAHPANAWAVDAVSPLVLRDVNGDGVADLVVVASAMSGVGAGGVRPFSVAGFWLGGPDGRFRRDRQGNARLQGLRRPTVSSALKWLRWYYRRARRGGVPGGGTLRSPRH